MRPPWMYRSIHSSLKCRDSAHAPLPGQDCRQTLRCDGRSRIAEPPPPAPDPPAHLKRKPLKLFPNIDSRTAFDFDFQHGFSFRRETDADRGFDGNLDELPPPARELLPEEDYFLPILNRPYTLVQPTRGCPHRPRVLPGVVPAVLPEFCRTSAGARCPRTSAPSSTWPARAWDRSEARPPSAASSTCATEPRGRSSSGRRASTRSSASSATTVKAAGISSLAHFILGLPGETK